MENKTCTKCSQTKPLTEFRRDNSTKKGYKQPCRKCNSIRDMVWQNANTEKSQNWQIRNRARVTQNNQKQRIEILVAYGKKCACCGETEPQFLALDHINNDGAAHRRELRIRGGGSRFYAWVIKNNFPSNLQLLCHNCNFSKGLYGECPHKKQQ